MHLGDSLTQMHPSGSMCWEIFSVNVRNAAQLRRSWHSTKRSEGGVLCHQLHCLGATTLWCDSSTFFYSTSEASLFLHTWYNELQKMQRTSSPVREKYMYSVYSKATVLSLSLWTVRTSVYKCSVNSCLLSRKWTFLL